MSHRFFVASPIVDDRAELTEAEAHHLLHVMRGKVGNQVTLFDGSGQEFTAEVTACRRSTVELRVVERHAVNRELPRAVELAAPLPKGDRQRWLVEKLVELGTTRFVPLVTERSIARPEAAAVERLRRTVVESSKQCGRNRLMEIVLPTSADEYFSQSRPNVVCVLAHVPGSDGPPANVQPLDPHAHDLAGPATLAGDVTTNKAADWALAVGPEGGWTDAEVQCATASGWQIVGLGSRILRLETAAIALVARFTLGWS